MYFEITNTVGNISILFHRFGSFFQVASNSPQKLLQSEKTKLNRNMVPNSIILIIFRKASEHLGK